MRLLSFFFTRKIFSLALYVVYADFRFSSDCAPEFRRQYACKLTEFCDESQRMKEVVVVSDRLILQL